MARLKLMIKHRHLGVLTGEAGSGKSMLIRHLFSTLESAVYLPIYLSMRRLTPRDFYGALLSRVGVEPVYLLAKARQPWDEALHARTTQGGKVIIPEHIESQAILNPEWQNTREYIPRSKRPVWVAVGLVGQLLIRDDGTCRVNGYCKPNNEGIATASSIGYIIKAQKPRLTFVPLSFRINRHLHRFPQVNAHILVRTSVGAGSAAM
ncbi:MAG: hypothetical protein A4E52_00505 [Pelotomaculum sp. PtaB.Bin013]|nr:MAG: hypothetical protein A4E52_00505 [Pelotomaculum sp. PtaB.Bin013]